MIIKIKDSALTVFIKKTLDRKEIVLKKEAK